MVLKEFAIWIFVGFYFSHVAADETGMVFTTISPLTFPHLVTLPTTPAQLRNFNYSNAFQYGFSIPLQPISVSADFWEKRIYFFDYYTRSIIQADPFSIFFNDSSTSYTFFHKGISKAILKVVVDWVAHNVYWTDPMNKWIAMQPEDAKDSSQYKIVVNTGLDRPLGVALDPIKGYLFWSDAGRSEKIERSLLSGESRTVLVSSGIVEPIGLAVDLTAGNLYWVDTVRDSLEYMKYDGTNRKIVRRLSHTTFFDVAIFGDVAIVSDVKHDRILFLNKLTGDSVANRFNRTLEEYYGVAMYHSDAQPKHQANCSTKGCSDICVSSTAGGTCMCREHYALDSNGRNCTKDDGLFHRGLIITNSTDICYVDIRVLSHPEYTPSCFYHESLGLDFLDVNTNQQEIVFVSRNKIYYMSIDAIGNAAELSSPTGIISGLGVDWRYGSVYWSESNTGNISVISRNPVATVPLLKSLDTPSGLTVLPLDGYMVWISGQSSNRRIERSNIDGSNRITLVNGTLISSPKGLTYDPNGKRVYWINSGDDSIKSVDVVDRDVRTDISGFSRTSLLLPYKAFLLFAWEDTSSITTTLVTTDKEGDPSARTVVSETVFEEMGLLTGIRAYDSSVQANTKGPCDDLNGGCEQICLAIGANRVCRCEFGFSPHANGKNCSSDPVTNNFILVSDWTHGVIYQYDMLTGSVQAVDVSVMFPTGVLYDHLTKTVYWGSTADYAINKIKLNGSDFEFVFNTGLFGTYPDRLAMDFTTRNLFYTAVASDNSFGFIAVVSPDGDHRKLITDLGTPRDIELDARSGYIFWTEWGENAYIGKANMDGSSVVHLANNVPGKEMKWANGLAVDTTAQKVYWTDGYHDKIESCNYDGTGRVTILSDDGTQLMDIAINGDYLYYLAWNNHYITKVRKDGTGAVEHLASNAELGRLDALYIYTGDNYTRSPDCSTFNGGCSTFCLQTSSGRVCACPDDVPLLDDHRTCRGVPQCPQSFSSAKVSDACYRYIGSMCSFTCDENHKPKPGVVSVTCTDNETWDKEPCEEILCPGTFLNGNITAGCPRKINNQCGYTCNDGYTKKPTISVLQCLLPGQWSEDTDSLCEANVCPDTVLNGQLADGCSREKGSSCKYNCDPGYWKRDETSELQCLPTGVWNADTTTICQALLCPNAVLNGRLADGCSREQSSSCHYTCNAGYQMKIGISSIQCLPTGNWSMDTRTLCEEMLCPDTVLNGRLMEGCARQIDNQCGYTCDDGYTKKPTISVLQCLLPGQWSEDTDSLCEEESTDKSPAEEQTSTNSAVYGVVGGVGGLVLIIAIVLTVVLLICFRRRRKQEERQRQRSASLPQVIQTPVIQSPVYQVESRREDSYLEPAFAPPRESLYDKPQSAVYETLDLEKLDEFFKGKGGDEEDYMHSETTDRRPNTNDYQRFKDIMDS